MKQRGRQSAAAQGIAVIDGGRGSRHAPPADLSDFESALWAQILGAMPADWYCPSAEEIMRAYVRCARTLRTIDNAVDELENPDMLGGIDPEAMAAILRLVNTRDKQVRQLAMLATKLRLTPQARVDPKTAGRAHRRSAEQPSGQPWDS